MKLIPAWSPNKWTSERSGVLLFWLLMIINWLIVYIFAVNIVEMYVVNMHVGCVHVCCFVSIESTLKMVFFAF